jgi:hypothetical protein
MPRSAATAPVVPVDLATLRRLVEETQGLDAAASITFSVDAPPAIEFRPSARPVRIDEN